MKNTKIYSKTTYKKIWAIMLCFVSIILLLSILSANIPVEDKAYAQGDYDFEIYFKVGEQTQIDLEDIEDNLVGEMLKVDMYMTAMSEPELGVATLAGLLRFDKSYFTLNEQDYIDASKSITEIGIPIPPF